METDSRSGHGFGLMKSWRRVTLGVILGMALLLRLYGAFSALPPEIRGDAKKYEEIGWNIASGRGFSLTWEGNRILPTAQVVGPLYPLFIALVYKVAGHQPDAVRLLQCFLGVLVCLVLYELGRLLFDSNIGLLVAGFGAVYPLLIRHSYFGGPVFLMTENLFALLLFLSVLALVHVQRYPTFSNQLVAGLCLGLSALTRASILAFPVALFIWLGLLRRWSWLVVLRMVGTVTIWMLLVIAPWTWRNYQVFHQVVPISTLGGSPLWDGNNPLARGGDAPAVPLPKHLTGLSPGQSWKYQYPRDEVILDRLCYQASWEALAANPRRVPWLMGKKVLVFWMFFDDSKTRQVNWAFLFAGLFALVGWWSARREPFRWLPVIVPAAYLTLIAMVFLPAPRYRAPVEPLLLILAAAGVAVILRLVARAGDSSG